MKYQSYIRSLFVAIFACFAVSTMAETYLNPFAYRLDNMVEKSGARLENDRFVVKYRLSGPATSVVIRLWDITNDATKSTWTRDGGNTGTALASFDITNKNDDNGVSCEAKGEHAYTIDFTDVIGQGATLHGKKVRWTIDVKGGNDSDDIIEKDVIVTNYTNSGNTQTSTETKRYKFIPAKQVTQSYGFRYPGSVDICNNPYDYNFGAIFCTESHVSTGVDGNDNASYVSYDNSPGVYVFGGGMERLWANYHERDISCYGANFSGAEHFVVNDDPMRALAPHRVRVTDDGRVFVTVAEGRNNILKQIKNPSNIDRTDRDNDGLYNDGGNFYEPDRTGGSYTDIFDQGTWVSKQLILQNSTNFIAAPNSGMAVRNSGSSLELLLLSANIKSNNNYTSNPSTGTIYPGINQGEWNLSRYNLGSNTTWGNNKSSEEVLETIKTSHNFANINEMTNKVSATDGTKLGDGMFVGFNYCGIDYDPNGGCWIAQYRGNNPVAATLVHYNATNKKVDYEEHITGRNSGGIRHNHNFSKLVVPGGFPIVKYFSYKKGSKTYTIKGTHVVEGYLTVYNTSYQNGTSPLNNYAYIENAEAGSGAHDFAWDFADNLYIASTGSHKLMALALPHKGKEVSTPCMEKFNFTLSPVYNFGVKVNPTVADADTYATIKHARIGKAPYPNYLHNANINLVAEEILDGCKFYQWSGYVNTATENGNQLTISSLAKSDPSVTAEIGICAYDDTDVLAVKKETKFPAAFVKRDMDNVSYSTICFPFDIETLTDELAGASVLKLTGITVDNSDGCTHVDLNFEEVTFTGDDIIKAGMPYLIQPQNNISGEFTLNQPVKCPVNSEFNNGYGAKDNTVTRDNVSVTFHGIMNKTTFDASEDNLFLVADDRLATLNKAGSIKGMRAFFTVSGASSKIVCKINTPDKVSTSLPYPMLKDSLQTTKYLWNGQIYIKRGNEVYDLTGAKVK